MNATTQAEHEVLEMATTEPRAANPVAVQQHSALAPNSPAAMMLAALAQGASLEQVEKMMDLQERWEKHEAEKVFNEALAQFKGMAVVIIKNKKVGFDGKAGGRTSYMHADLAAVVQSVGPALSECGFSWSWKITEQKPTWIEVTCYLKHRMGHCETVSIGGPPDQTGSKNALQAINSTVSYLERYTFKAITGVAEQDDDDDGNGGDGRPTRLEMWSALALTCKSAADMVKVYRDATKDFTKAKDVAGYATFAKVATKHGSQLREQEEQKALAVQKAEAEQRSSEDAEHA